MQNGLQIPLPCAWCSNIYDPICAQPTSEGGETQTFESECRMMAENCGQFEKSKRGI